jgi:hypothetical protein
MATTTFAESTRLRAELDGLIAHLYNIIEEDLLYILTTFPLVPDSIKVAAQNAYRDIERGLITMSDLPLQSFRYKICERITKQMLGIYNLLEIRAISNAPISFTYLPHL